MSFAPEASRPFVGCHLTAFTSQLCPVLVLSRQLRQTNRFQRTMQDPLLLHCLKRPQLDRLIIRSRHKPRIVRRKGDISNWFVVAIERLQVVHVGLEIFDLAAVESGN